MKLLQVWLLFCFAFCVLMLEFTVVMVFPGGNGIGSGGLTALATQLGL